MRTIPFITLLVATLFFGCHDGERNAEAGLAFEMDAGTRTSILALSPLPVVPPDRTNRVADNPDAAHLGQFLFFDTRLSGTGQHACASCHDPVLGFADRLRLGRGKEELARHSPTLLNVAHNRWFFWDGRSDSLWAQVRGPIEHPKEMAGSRTGVARLIRNDAALRAAYQAIFVNVSSNDDRVFSNVAKSIAAYERLLLSGPAPFDRFVEGLREGDAEKIGALSASAQRGLALFVGRGQCTLCHTGPLFTDREFHNLGLERPASRPIDLGRYDGIPEVLADPFNGLGAYSDHRKPTAHRKLRFVTRKDNNLGEFKTPSLRDVARTPPYMHDGRFDTLEEVVRFYSDLDDPVPIGHREETLAPLALSDDEVQDLVAFLESLTGPPTPDALRQSPPTPRR